MDCPNECAHVTSQCWGTLCGGVGPLAIAGVTGGERVGAACWQGPTLGWSAWQTTWSAERRQGLAWYMWLGSMTRVEDSGKSSKQSG